MTQFTGPLEFFIVEATEYVESLDALLGTASRSGPDPERFGKAARGLRGSATMARQYGIADLANALERGARALREGRLRWDPAIHAAFVSAVDDLRILLRAVRSWGMREEERVLHRLAELDRIVPALEGTTTRITPRTSSAGIAFLSKQTADLSEAIAGFRQSPSDQARLDALLDRARSLRGVATLRDLPPLSEVVDAIDDLGKTISLAARPVTAGQLALFDAAGSVLELASREIAAGGRPDSSGTAVQRFSQARSALARRDDALDRIVPIGDLFASGTVGIIHASTHPPTSAAQRFRLEVVSQAEHLRRVIADARLPGDPGSDERIQRELNAALQSLLESAESFGERRVASFVGAWRDRVLRKEPRAISAVDEAATLLADASCTPERLTEGLERLLPDASRETRPPVTPLASTPVSTTPVASRAAVPGETARAPSITPASAPAAPPRERKRRTPSGRELHDALAVGLNGFAELGSAPLGAAPPLPEEVVVPIEHLLYRGRAALERARSLREELRRAGGHPSQATLEELYDLIELASTE
jgi:chemotaxis protein histidine kinase CheA